MSGPPPQVGGGEHPMGMAELDRWTLLEFDPEGKGVNRATVRALMEAAEYLHSIMPPPGTNTVTLDAEQVARGRAAVARFDFAGYTPGPPPRPEPKVSEKP